MATDVERLVVSLEASAKKFESAMNRAVGVTNNSMRSVERRTEQAAARINQAFSRMGTTLKAGLAGIFAGLSVQQVAQFADSFTKVQNSLKVAGLEGQALTKTYNELYAAAQRNGTPLESIATLYQRVSLAQNELNVSSAQIIGLTNNVALALRVAGADAATTSSTILQLSQALSGGKVQWEDYEPMLDTAQPLLRAVAAGMAEAGGEVNKLSALVKDGKVSSEAFFRAFEAGAPILEKMASTTGQTLSQGAQKASNALTNLVGRLDEALSASNAASGGVNSFAASIDSIAAHVPTAINALNQLQAKMAEIGNADIFKRINEGLESMGLSGMNGVVKNNMFDQAFGAKTNAGSMAGYKPGAAKPAAVAPIKPVSLANYAVPEDAKKGRGGKSARERENELQREIQQIQERTRALDAERQTVGMSAGDAAKAEAAFRLLEAAKEANVAVTPQLKAQIDSLAAAYGEATQKIEDAREAQDAVQQAAQEFAGTLSNAFSDAILEGERLDEVGKKLLKTFASRAMDNIFSALFSSGGGGGGIIGGLLSGIFGKRAAGGPVSSGKPYLVGERGPELMVPTSAGKVVPNHKLGGSAAKPSITIVQHIAANGDQAVAQISLQAARQALAQYDRGLPSRINDINTRFG